MGLEALSAAAPRRQGPPARPACVKHRVPLANSTRWSFDPQQTALASPTLLTPLQPNPCAALPRLAVQP